jgi:coenzyme F420-reducing hydrogenase delta subunit/ferredoxin
MGPHSTNEHVATAGAHADSLRALARDWLQRLEESFDRWLGPHNNPWRHLGALGFLFFWIIAVTGIYLYAFFDTSVQGAYASVQYLSRQQWWLGGVVRSLHRYASDAFMLVMLLHLVRELVYGRYHGFRWFTWVTGVPLLWIGLLAGIVGFWLVWDELAQFSAVATAEWFDWLGLFAEPFARNFVAPERVDDRFFSLLVFLHIGLPLLLLLAMWVHIQRLIRPDTRPSARLTWGSTGALVLLSLAVPVASHSQADLARVPGQLAFDWFYLAPNAAVYAWSPGGLWAVAGVATALLLICPLLPHPRRAPVAEVDPANCNGCGWCFADCPYAAITLAPRSDGRPAARVAVVAADLCASCGICTGACPSSTPFRSVAELVSGIDMPQLPIGQVRSRLKAQLARLKGDVKIVLFGCDHGADVRALQAPDTAAISLLCTGQLPPAFVEYAIRRGADGVLVVACREGGCEFRLGERFTLERLERRREPYLRRTLSEHEWRLVWAGRHDGERLRRELEAFREQLRSRSAVSAEPQPRELRHAPGEVRNA